MKRNQCLDQAEDQHAHHRARHETHAATQQGAADDHGGDGVEFKADARRGISRLRVEGVNHPGQRRTEARQGVDQDFRARHRQTHQPRRRFVAAQRVNRAAKLRVVCDHDGREKNHRITGRRERHADFWIQMNRQRLVHRFDEERVINAERLRANDKAQAAHEKHPRQRDEKRRQFKHLDQTTHHRAEHRPDEKRQRDGRRGLHVPFADRRRNNNAGECDHRSDRQINSTGENHKRRAHRRDAEKGVVAKEIHHHSQRKEFREQQPARKIQREHHRRGRQQRNVFGCEPRFHFVSWERRRPAGQFLDSPHCNPPARRRRSQDFAVRVFISVSQSK